MTSLLSARVAPPGFRPVLDGYFTPLNFASLPQIEADNAVIYAGLEGVSEFNLANYLTIVDGTFYCMWSSGVIWNDEDGQRVYYSTSGDGMTWSPRQPMTSSPPPSGFRQTARGFWQRGGDTIGLYALDEAGSYFGPSLELRGVTFTSSGPGADQFIEDNAINNFPPVASGDKWIMEMRGSDNVVRIAKGDIGSWNRQNLTVDVPGTLSEPLIRWAPPGVLVATFRNDNARRICQSLSTDGGDTWAPVKATNFPDSGSKHFILELSSGLTVLCSNSAQDLTRHVMTLAVSRDGRTFDKVFILNDTPTTPKWFKTERRIGYQYPHMIEHNGYLFIAYSRNQEDILISRVSLEDLQTE